MMHHFISSFLVLLLATASLPAKPPKSENAVPWAGEGRHRVLVRVDPVKLSQRKTDELPTELKIDFAALLEKQQVAARPDLTTIQVVQYDPRTGRPVEYANYAYGKSPYDRPFRWYDDAMMYQFPEFHDTVLRTGGEIVRKPRVRGGYFFNAIGDWKKGRLAWMHTQHGGAPTYYAIYFDVLSGDPQQAPPRGWLGDGLPRCDRAGATTMGADHCRIDLDDWNGDGLIDIIAGEQYGHVFWWPNLGTKKRPVFRYCKFVFDHAGLPLDVGMAAAPKVVDYDGDGAKDLLVGTEWNRVLYYQNRGTNQDRRLGYRGLLKLAGKPLALPVTPLQRGSPQVFRRDYYPVLETVDWDRDGDVDLLAGGYITGRIFFYEKITDKSNAADPALRYRGPVNANGKPLNVGHWCAAPCAADFDGDGDLDLMSGNMPMHLKPSEKSSSFAFLQYWENSPENGNRQPLSGFRKRPFPGEGEAPRTHLATPRAFDWDDDGDLDLVVSARQNIYLFENKGDRSRPHFHLHSKPLPVTWGLAPIAVNQFRDWNKDGKLDLVQNYTVRINSGVGNPYRWQKTVSVLPPGKTIEHPSHTGDDWFWPFLDDFDQDGKTDVLFGDWFGHVWFHRNLSTAAQRFDMKGVRFELKNGKRIQVGPIGKDPEKDFDALQGARTVLTTGDFNRDSLRDLIVGDTYGKVRYFRNVGDGAKAQFAEPIEVGDLGIRLLVDAADWNSDGWLDIVAGAANGKVRVFLNNRDAQKPFQPGFDPGLPPILQPRVLMADINGDGDEDLFLPSTQGSCFVERSFLQHGYAPAKLLAVERKQP